MTQPVDLRPAELVLSAAVARRYYLAGRSKVEIAEEFGISRFQVARLLRNALESGVVRITIGGRGALDLDLSSRLQDAYGLRHVVVVEAPVQDLSVLRTRLGETAAHLLEEIVTPQDVIGVAWARAVSALAAAVSTLPPIPFVQLTGALSGSDIDDSAVELVRRLSRVAGGPAQAFYAPMIVSDSDTAKALRSQPQVAQAFARFGQVTKAVVGIGLWASGRSTVYDSATPADRQLLRDLGVCAECSGAFVTAEGQPVHSDLTDRIIGIDAEQLAAIPEVIGIPYGDDKAPAVRAALRSGLVTSLVTHTSLAELLLDGAGRHRPDDR